MAKALAHYEKRGNLIVYLVLLFAAIFTLIPLLWGLSTSLKPPSEISKFPPTPWATKIDLGSYARVIFGSNFRIYFGNSILITFLCILSSTLVASHASYALARLDIPHKSTIMFSILMVSMVPTVALLIPLYQLSVKLGLYNTRGLLIFIYTAWRTPFLIWILYGFFEKIPFEIEEAARVDGCSKIGIFYKIVLPISQPGLVSAALLTAVYVWNDFLVAFTFTTKENLRMVSVGLYNYISQYGIQWGELMAAVMISIIPVILLFIIMQKKFVSGLAAGAVKG